MKATRFKVYVTSFVMMFVLGMALTPMIASAQDGDKEKTEAAKDNSSAFNDSVQFDDMEPIFYEAKDEAKKEEVASEGGSGVMLYVGIAIVLIVVLVVLKKVGKKKA